MPKTTILSILISCILALSFLAPSSTDAAILNANDADSLIAAINIANANPDFDTILLTDNIILNAVDNMTNGANGLPAIVNDVEINGQGFSISRNGGAPNFRFFYISSDDHLTLRNMTLSGGSVLGGGSPDGAGGAILNDNYLIISNVIFDNNSADFGGAIESRGTTYISDSIFSNNTANLGGAIEGSGNNLILSRSILSGNSAFLEGGAILIYVTATIVNTTISNNTTDGVGGGIYNDGNLNLRDSVVSNNIAPSAGGIANFSSVNLTNTVIEGNQANSSGGGGILNFGMLTTFNTTISNNTSSSEGGGLHNEAPATLTKTAITNNTGGTFGGGIWNGFVGTLDILNSTVSGNSASSDGGGILNNGLLRPTSTTIVDNTATGDGGGIFNDDFGGTTIANNTIIAGNTATNFLNCAGTFVGLGTNNLSENIANDGCNASFGNITPSLDFSTTLADNGAPTQTHALLNLGGNPAIDASNASAPEVDQRGVPIQGAGRDIGAYELDVDPTYPTVAFASSGEIYLEAPYIFVPINLTMTGANNFADIAEVYVVDTYSGTALSANSTAPEGDYEFFPPLQSASIDCTSGTCSSNVQVLLSIGEDTIIEGPETAILAIVGHNGFVQLGSPDEFVATIIDNTTVTLATNDPTAVEDPTDNGQFTVDMGVPNSTGSTVTIDYSITGSATNGTDYTALSGSVDISVGAQTATIDVLPLNDNLLEGTETVTLSLTNSSIQNILVDLTPATVTIDDFPPQTANFDVALSKTGALASGEVGLSGDTLIWTITATNVSQLTASDVVISDTFSAELQIEDATITQGSVSVSGQTVTVNIGAFNIGETATITITTTVLSLPTSGQFNNTAILTGGGQTVSASAVVSGITGLPSTGYAPRFRW